MTRDEAREFAKIVQAYAQGEDVQFRDSPTDAWATVKNPEFDSEWMLNWRIKPKEPRHLWTVVNCNGYMRSPCFDESEANEAMERLNKEGGWPPYTIIHSIEVLP